MTAEDPSQEIWKSSLLLNESAGGESDEDISSVSSLRPRSFAEYIGQQEVKDNLSLACRAASARGEPLDHVLLHGPPGLGKTSLAYIIAKEMNVNVRVTSGPVVERPGDLAAILTSLQKGDILFIDEIHRMPRVVEEVLYPALEDYQIDIMIGQGPSAKSVQVPLKPFTLIGATTRTSLLTSPLRDRFGMIFRLNFYSPAELADIVRRSAELLGVSIEKNAALAIGSRSRGTPRIANRILKRVRDYAQEDGAAVINLEHVEKALSLLNIDVTGLDAMDRQMLEVVIDKFSGGPVGIETIAATLGEERSTLEEVYEPFLLQEGFLARTRQGRVATDKAYDHLGKNKSGISANQGQLNLRRAVES